jgi:uncharacterized small protein (DUF1192 family)
MNEQHRRASDTTIGRLAMYAVPVLITIIGTAALLMLNDVRASIRDYGTQIASLQVEIASMKAQLTERELSTTAARLNAESRISAVERHAQDLDKRVTRIESSDRSRP